MCIDDTTRFHDRLIQEAQMAVSEAALERLGTPQLSGIGNEMGDALESAWARIFTHPYA